MQRLSKIVCTFLFLFACSFCFAQTDDYVGKPKEPKKQIDWKEIRSRLYTGGNVGAQFGTFTFINLSPVIGYNFSERFSLATGPIYYFLRSNAPGYSQSSFSAYGARLYGRYFVLENVFLHSEYETLNGKWDYTKKRFFVPSFFAGAGYRQKLGDRLSLTFMVLWNFLTGPYSPYQNPVIRGGFNIAL